MNKPAILILSTDAMDYLPCLQDLVQDGASLDVAASSEEARKTYSGQRIILGQPDLVAEVLAEMPAVQWVQSTWAGIKPLLDLGRSGYLLTGVKDTFGPQMAEYVLAYMLAQELKIYERLGRQAHRLWWEEPSGTLRGKVLGIMGTGSIGRHIAEMAKPFGMQVLGFNRSGTQAEGFAQVFCGNDLAEFLAKPDYLVCVLPDTADTRRLLNDEAFRAMKDSCCLINVGRGNVIDETELTQALFAGELAAAVLDVFQHEPLPVGSPLWNAPGVIVTGHVAASSWPEDIAAIFKENYRRYCAGESLKYQVDFERGY